MKPTSHPKLANNLVVLSPGSIWLGFSPLTWWRMTQPQRHRSVSPPLWQGATCPWEMSAEDEHKCLQAGTAVSMSKQVLNLRSHSCRSSSPNPGQQELMERSVTVVQWLVCCLGDAACFCNVLIKRKGPTWWSKLEGMTFESLMHCYGQHQCRCVCVFVCMCTCLCESTSACAYLE